MSVHSDAESSVLASHLSSKAAVTFPRHRLRPATMDPPVKKIFAVLLQCESSLLDDLEKAGYASPARIVNSFGGQPKTIAYAFGKVGVQHFQTVEGQRLIIFARLQLKHPFEPAIVNSNRLHSRQKTRHYDAGFSSLSEDKIADLAFKLDDDEQVCSSMALFQAVKEKLRTWLNRPEPPSVVDLDNISEIAGPSLDGNPNTTNTSPAPPATPRTLTDLVHSQHSNSCHP